MNVFDNEIVSDGHEAHGVFLESVYDSNVSFNDVSANYNDADCIYAVNSFFIQATSGEKFVKIQQVFRH